MMRHLLIVDDDADFAATLGEAFIRRGCRVSHFSTVAATLQGLNGQAATRLPAGRFDAAILDLRLENPPAPAESGLALIAPLRDHNPHMRILLLTGYANIATAVAAIKLGATHYLPKPSRLEDILDALGRESGNVCAAVPDAPITVDRLEWEHIHKVLAEQDGNISAAARMLKMHRRTLQRKLSKRPSPG